jgi:outer membrane protein TolC
LKTDYTLFFNNSNIDFLQMFIQTKDTALRKDRRFVSCPVAEKSAAVLNKTTFQRLQFFFLLLLLFLCPSSCTKSISQLVEERNLISDRDYSWLHDRLEGLDCIELTLDEAIEFALNYNLDLQVEQAELRIAGDAIGREIIQALPNLQISALYARRSNLLISTSEAENHAFPPGIPSFSSLKTSNLWNVELAWNILNSGIQYFRVKEAKNSELAREFVYQRTSQNLIKDVVATYWLVAIMQESEKKIDELTEISRELAKRLHEKVDDGSISLQKATEVIGRIYYQQVQAKLFLRSYQGSEEQFKALLGIPPCLNVILKVPKEKEIPGPLPPPNELHRIALNYRPELYQIDAEMAVHEDELKAAILTIFPQLNPFAGFSYDCNPFLKYKYWATVGFRVIYDLISIPLSLNSQMTARDQICLSRAQRVSLSLAVLSQVHIIYALYEDALDRFKDAKIYWKAKKYSYELALAKKNLGAIGDLDYVFSLSDLGYAETQMNLFYVEVMGYLEQLSNTIGIPRYFTADYGVEQLVIEDKE